MVYEMEDLRVCVCVCVCVCPAFVTLFQSEDVLLTYWHFLLSLASQITFQHTVDSLCALSQLWLCPLGLVCCGEGKIELFRKFCLKAPACLMKLSSCLKGPILTAGIYSPLLSLCFLPTKIIISRRQRGELHAESCRDPERVQKKHAMTLKVSYTWKCFQIGS